MEANKYQVGGNHYKNMQVEPWDVIDTWPIEQRIGAYRAGALKYTMRMGTKDEQLQEVRKAKHYLEKLVECLSDKLPNKSEIHPSDFYPPRSFGFKDPRKTLEEAYEHIYKGE